MDALTEIACRDIRSEWSVDYIDTIFSLMRKLDDREVEAIRRKNTGNPEYQRAARKKNQRNWALRHEICWKLRGRKSALGDCVYQHCVRRQLCD